MAWIEGLEESIGTELGLIVTTPEYNKRKEQEFDDHHNWLWRKIKRYSPMRFRFNSPPKYPHKGRIGAILIPDMPTPNSIDSTWGVLIGINYRGGGEFDHPNTTNGIGSYRVMPENISVMEPPGIIKVEGILNINEEEKRKINLFTTVESTRAANLHYILRDLDKFLK
jgi:hypothetical protein